MSLADGANPGRTGVEEVTVAGNYFGTLTVPAGKTLVVSDRPAPLSAYDVPQQENLVAWFDPSLDGAIDFHQSASGGVGRLYSRTASGVDKTDGAYWMGMQANGGLTASSGRYPFRTGSCPTVPSRLSVFPSKIPSPWRSRTSCTRSPRSSGRMSP